VFAISFGLKIVRQVGLFYAGINLLKIFTRTIMFVAYLINYMEKMEGKSRDIKKDRARVTG